MIPCSATKQSIYPNIDQSKDLFHTVGGAACQIIHSNDQSVSNYRGQRSTKMSFKKLKVARACPFGRRLTILLVHLNRNMTYNNFNNIHHTLIYVFLYPEIQIYKVYLTVPSLKNIRCNTLSDINLTYILALTNTDTIMTLVI